MSAADTHMSVSAVANYVSLSTVASHVSVSAIANPNHVSVSAIANPNHVTISASFLSGEACPRTASASQSTAPQQLPTHPIRGGQPWFHRGLFSR